MRLEEEYSDEQYIQILLASYRDHYFEDPELTKELIRTDIESFAEAEKYEVCARLQKILQRLE